MSGDEMIELRVLIERLSGQIEKCRESNKLEIAHLKDNFKEVHDKVDDACTKVNCVHSAVKNGAIGTLRTELSSRNFKLILWLMGVVVGGSATVQVGKYVISKLGW